MKNGQKGEGEGTGKPSHLFIMDHVYIIMSFSNIISFISEMGKGEKGKRRMTEEEVFYAIYVYPSIVF